MKAFGTFWNSTGSAGHLAAGVFLGVVIFWAFRTKKVRAPKKKLSLKGYLLLAGILFAAYSAGSGGTGIVKGIIHPSVRIAGGTLSCSQLENLWIKAGGSRGAAFMAAEIARAESGGRQYARDPASGYYADGNVDIGYWQVNTVHGNIPYDPIGNAQAAIRVSNNGSDWTPWVTYNKGLEVGQC